MAALAGCGMTTLTFAPAALAIALLLTACGDQPQGETSDDFASRVGTGAPAPAATVSGAPAAGPALPAHARSALKTGTAYVRSGGEADANSLDIRPDGTFVLVENGRPVTGRYEWLPDGRRLRLGGVVNQPLVLVGDGALYRMQNENVPFDDVSPDRTYLLPGSTGPK